VHFVPSPPPLRRAFSFFLFFFAFFFPLLSPSTSRKKRLRNRDLTTPPPSLREKVSVSSIFFFLFFFFLFLFYGTNSDMLDCNRTKTSYSLFFSPFNLSPSLLALPFPFFFLPPSFCAKLRDTPSVSLSLPFPLLSASPRRAGLAGGVEKKTL